MIMWTSRRQGDLQLGKNRRGRDGPPQVQFLTTQPPAEMVKSPITINHEIKRIISETVRKNSFNKQAMTSVKGQNP